MAPTSRREFLDHVSRGMLVAGLGASVSSDLGFSTAFAEEGSEKLSFGPYDALVDLLQSTPPDKLQPLLVAKLQRGETDLKSLIAAGALSNAECFGGEDYVGFHTAMAMLPALGMSDRLTSERRPLPVLKVLYRNSQQIQALGGASHTTLKAMKEHDHHAPAHVDVQIRDACRIADVQQGEALFSTLKNASLEDQFNALQPAVEDDINVHRFVFAHRTFGLAQMLGKEYAHDILRQCVRFCCDHERNRINRKGEPSAIRTVLPKLLDEHKLAGKSFGTRDPGDAWVDETSLAIYKGPPARSAEIVAAAIAEGIDREVIGEAISLASNLLALRQGPDRWRTHGDAAGVHASDATTAWRNIARVTAPRHAIAGLIVAAYHSASHSPFNTPPYPTADHRGLIKSTDAAGLLAEAEDAVKQNDQGRAAAAIQIYGERGFAPEGVLETMLRYTISEDGRLHGEKYFQTVVEEYRTIRPAFRWREMVSLARVTASAYGYDRDDKHGFHAPGYEEACRLLGVTA
jgi:hypothetical protein